MILTDTGPIVALFDRDDNHHRLCVEMLKKTKEPLVTTWPVITEAFYFLNFSSQVQEDLWEFIMRGGIKINPIEENLYRRCRELMKKYSELQMDLTDATLVAAGEELKLDRIFTLDHRGFHIYKPKHRKRFTLIPAEL